MSFNIFNCISRFWCHFEVKGLWRIIKLNNFCHSYHIWFSDFQIQFCQFHSLLNVLEDLQILVWESIPLQLSLSGAQRHSVSAKFPSSFTHNKLDRQKSGKIILFLCHSKLTLTQKRSVYLTDLFWVSINELTKVGRMFFYQSYNFTCLLIKVVAGNGILKPF